MAAIFAPLQPTANQTISLLEKCNTMSEMRQIHAHMIKSSLVYHTVAVSRLLAFCSLSGLSGSLDHATSVFLRIREPNSFIYFAIIKGFADSSTPFQSVVLFSQMLCSLDNFDGLVFSLPSVLKACGRSSAFKEGLQVHGQISKTLAHCDPFVSNSVVRMYIELGETDLGRRVFDKMTHKDVVSYNSMIGGYLKAGKIELARLLFDEMPERDLVSWNSMIDGYAKCGRCDLARELFDMVNHKDVVSWTAMISGYVFNGRPKDALDLFREMLSLRIKPDAAAVVSVLSAIADLGFVEEGKWVHAYISANKIRLSSGFVGSALIDMYSKCGYVENAYDVFRSIKHKKNIADWNSMISGLATNGLGQEALEVFHDMEIMEIAPNDISFLGVLSSCSHGGLVVEGQFYFKLMQEKYRIVPKIQHHGCMIDLFGRAGHLEEALGVIKDMPLDPDVLAWKAMLSACIKHGHVEIGEQAALSAIELSPKDSSCYVLLSNLYARAGRWNDVANIRSIMRERGIRKVPGCSSIVANGEIHEFLVGKEMDIRYKDVVLAKLEEVICRLKLEGYEPDLTQVLLDVEEQGKENLLCLHSEKMAVAFGLININRGAPIHIVKNLRVCCDCHCFIKLVSRAYNKKIIVRDQNRFHHFKNGFCSCNDYW